MSDVRSRLRGYVVLAVVLGLSAGAAVEAELPPAECVQLLRQARLARMHDDLEASLAALHQAAESFPDELIPIVALLDHHRRFDRSATEVDRLRALLTQRLADAERPVPQGTIDYLVQDPGATPEDLVRVHDAVSHRLTRSGTDLELLTALSVLQGRLERLEELHGTLQRMLSARPSPELHWQCLTLDLDSERWEEATEHLRLLLANDPDSMFMRMTYVEALARAGNYDELLKQLELVERQVASLPGLARGELRELLLNVAWGLRDAAEDARAESMFRRLLALDPAHPAARLALLHFYSSPEERQAHEVALARKWSAESDPQALLDEGAALLAGGDAAGAFDLLQRAAQALPDSEIANFNLGLAAIRLQRWVEAEQALGRAARLNPARAETQLNQGIALHYLKRWEAAVDPLRRALELQPELTQAHYYLHECYKSLGRAEQAAAELVLYNQSVER